MMPSTYYRLFVFVFFICLSCSDNASDPVPSLISDLDLDLSVDNNRPEIDSNVTFTISVSNAGPDAATNIQVEGILSTGYTYLEDNGDTSYNPNTGQWSIEELGLNASISLNITAKVNATGDYNFEAAITASSNEDPDSTPNNDLITEDDQDSQRTNPFAPSNVEVTTHSNLSAADALALDARGLLYATNYGESILYTVDTTGESSVLLSDQPGAAGIAFDEDGHLFLARYNSTDIIRRDVNTGEVSLFASSVPGTIALDFDSKGNLYTNNNVNNFITKIDPNGNQERIPVNVFNNSSLAIDEEDNIYVSDYNSGMITVIDAETNLSRFFANIPLTTGGIGYLIYSNNHFYATAIAEGTIHQIDMEGKVKRIAGSTSISGSRDGDANTATFHSPIGIVASADGKTLYVAQYGSGGSIRIITGFDE